MWATARFFIIDSYLQCLLLSGLNAVQKFWANPDAIWWFETGSLSQMSSTDRVWHMHHQLPQEVQLTKICPQKKPTNQVILDSIHCSRRTLKQLITSLVMCLHHTQDTQQILACSVCTENRWEPCSDVDLKRCSFIGIHKHISIPRRSAWLSVLRLCLRMAGHRLNVQEARIKNTNTQRGEWKRWAKLNSED